MTDKRLRSGVSRLAALLVLGLAPVAFTAPLVAEELAHATVYSGGVDLQPTVNFGRAIVTISGGGKTFIRTFEEGEFPSVGLEDLEGNSLPDGSYSWELQLVPDARTARELRLRATRNGGEAPDAWQRQSGSFWIRGGLAVVPEAFELGSAQARSSGLETSMQPSAGLGSTSFGRAEAAVDDDAAVGSRVGVEKEMRAAARAAPGSELGAGLVQAGRTASERSDEGALAMGGSLEPMFNPQPKTSLFGEAKPAPRSISPDGENGRPRSKDELR